MKEVLHVDSENKSKVEDILKKDDIVSRGSITIKSPSSLDMKEEGYFFILDMPEESIKRTEDLVKGLAKKHPHAKEIIKKVDDQENAAMEGFGNILG